MINVGTLIAQLKLEDRLTPALMKASASLQRTGAKMKAIGGSMQATGMSLTMGLTAPIIGFGAAVGVAFGSFESSMNRVKALTGTSDDPLSFKRLTDQAKELGKTTKFSAGEAADAMGFLAMAGFDTNKIIGAMPGVLELAASAQLDLASAADITSNIMTGYGKTTEELGHVNNVLVKSFSSGNVDLRQLGEAFKYVGPVAKSAGVSFEEASASITMMGNAGIQGSMAGTALRGAISKLLNPTSKAAKEMRNLGMSAVDSHGNLRPMSDIVQQLGDRGATTAQMMTIFGLRAGPAMAGLVSQGHESLRKLTGELEGVGNIAQEIAEIQMRGLAGAFTRFKSAANGAMIEMGEQLAPTFERVLEIGITFSNWISDTLVPAFASLSPTTQGVVFGLTALLAAIGPVLMMAGTFTMTVGSLLSALGGTAGLGSALLKVVAFLTGPLGLALALVSVLMAFKPTRDIVISIATMLKEGLVFAIRKVVEWVAKAGKVVSDWWSDFKDGNEVLSAISEGLGVVGKAFGDLTGWFKKTADAAKKLNEKALSPQEKFMARLQKRAEDLSEEIAGNITPSMGELTAMFKKLNPLMDGSEEMMGALADRAVTLFENGETLTPSLRKLVEQFRAEALAVNDATGELGDNVEVTDELDKAVVSLQNELSGANLLADLERLKTAWAGLSPEIQSNERAMRVTGEMALRLAEDGAVLEGELLALSIAAQEVTEEIDVVEVKLSETERAARSLADEFSGKNLLKQVEALEGGLALLKKEENNTLDGLLQVGEAALKLRNDGAKLGDELDSLANLFRNTQSAANDFVGPPQIEKQIGLLGKLKGSLGGLIEGLTGGAGFGGFLSKMGTGIVEGFGNIISGGMASVMNMGVDLAMKGAVKIGKKIAGMFGRSTEDNLRLTATRMWGIALTDTAAKAAAEMSEQVGDDFAALILTLGQTITESGGVMALGFTNVTIAARATFSAIEQGKITAEQGLEALEPVLRNLATEFGNAGEAGQTQFLELITLAQSFGMDMDAITEAIGEDLVNQALGKDLPTVVGNMRGELRTLKLEGLDPFVAKLVDLGVITNDDLTAINELMHGSQVDFRAMEEAANKYGIELSSLGPKFDEARLNEIAANISADFAMLTENGADVRGVIAGMGDEINALVKDAQNAGVAIPDNMRPVLSQMIEMGTLVGANGEAITDMSQVNFAEPMADKFDKVVDKLGVMINKFLDLLGLTDDLTTSVQAIPSDVSIGVGFNVEKMPSFDMPDMDWDWGNVDMNWESLDWPQRGEFSHGTHGKFVDFGSGTPAMLHGKERVQTLAEGQAEGAGMAVLEKRLGSIERLLRDQPRAFGLAISDSLTLIN